MMHAAATTVNLRIVSLALLCSGLFASKLIAGEVIVTLPDTNIESVVSLHAVDRKVTSIPLKQATKLYQKNRQFSPHLIVIPTGSVVDMTNDDVVYHNVFSFSKAKPFDLGLYPFGDHKEILFDKAGAIMIFCAVHPQMYSMILVMDTPWFKQSKGNTELRFSDIPTGMYEVRLWYKNKFMDNNSEITVLKKGLVRINFAHQSVETSQ